MDNSLKPGISFTLSKTVDDRDTARSLGSGGLNVLGTPFLIALMENAAKKIADDCIEATKTTVGTNIDMRHLAATPVGMEIKVSATLTEIDGRKLVYSIEAWDEKEKIADGTHERFIVDSERFLNKAQSKLEIRRKGPLSGRSLLTLKDYSGDEILYLLDLAASLKKKKQSGIFERRLLNKNIALIFEKPSTRTRCAFTTAAADEGAHPEYLGINDIQLGHKESIEDTARVLGGMFDGIEFRGFSQRTAEILAEYSGVPVWNGLTDEDHPTQVLADFLTVKETFGTLSKIPFVFIGDGRNNVANALMIGASKTGMDYTVCAPKTLQPDMRLLSECLEYASESGAIITVTDNPQEAVKGAMVIYTDVWASMGEEGKSAERKALLTPYRVDAELMRQADERAVFMHCLPAIKGEEVTEEVFESQSSAVFMQSENRMHTIKAVMVAALGE